MIFPEVKIHQPDCFEDFRGELYTLFKQEEHENKDSRKQFTNANIFTRLEAFVHAHFTAHSPAFSTSRYSFV